jgi:hypothetical protein
MKGHVSVINTILSKGENVDAVTNVSHKIVLRYVSVLSVSKGIFYNVVKKVSKARIAQW